MKMQLFHYKTSLIFLAQPEMSHDRVYTLVQCARKNWNVESKLKSFLGIFADGHLLYFFPSFAENSLLFQTEYQVLILNMKQ